jgi:hypothetical protein
VRARLLNRARETRQDFNLILTRYAPERLLYRLSISAHADLFLLKGALQFDLWFDVPHRPTRDAEFLARKTHRYREGWRNLQPLRRRAGAKGVAVATT